jgi:hypothetical protein
VGVQAGERLIGAHNAQMGHGADARVAAAAKRCRRLTVGDVERHSTYGSNKGERRLRKQLGGCKATSNTHRICRWCPKKLGASLQGA